MASADAFDGGLPPAQAYELRENRADCIRETEEELVDAVCEACTAAQRQRGVRQPQPADLAAVERLKAQLASAIAHAYRL